jgi:hypothetical protein
MAGKKDERQRSLGSGRGNFNLHGRKRMSAIRDYADKSWLKPKRRFTATKIILSLACLAGWTYIGYLFIEELCK